MGDSSAYVILAASGNISWAGTFKMAHSSIWTGLSWISQESKSQLLCFSYNLAIQDSPEHKGKWICLLKLRPSTVISVPFYWWVTSSFIYHLWPCHLCPMLTSVRTSIFFFISGPSDEMKLFLMFQIQTANRFLNLQDNSKTSCSKNFCAQKLVQSQVELGSFSVKGRDCLCPIMAGMAWHSLGIIW